jgi:hypothetical protein
MYLSNFDLFCAISTNDLSKIAFLHAFHLDGSFILVTTSVFDNYLAAQNMPWVYMERNKLTVSTSQRTSPGETLSPSFFTHLAIFPYRQLIFFIPSKIYVHSGHAYVLSAIIFI